MNRRRLFPLLTAAALLTAMSSAAVAGRDAGEGIGDDLSGGNAGSVESTSDHVLRPASGDVSVADYHRILADLDYSRIPAISELAVYENFPSPIEPNVPGVEELQMQWKDVPRSEFVLDGKYRDVSVSHDGVCAVQLDGTLACWVLREQTSSLWLRSVDEFSSGVRATESLEDRFVEIDLAAFWVGEHEEFSALLACGLGVTGVVRCWGSNDYGQLDVPEGRYLQVEVASSYVCGLTLEREAVCWGDIEGNFSEGDGFSRRVEGMSPLGNLKTLSEGARICGLGAEWNVACWAKDYYSSYGSVDYFLTHEWSVDSGWFERRKEPSLFNRSDWRGRGNVALDRRDLSYGFDGGVYYRDVQAGDGRAVCGLEFSGAISCLEERISWRDFSSVYASYGDRSGYLEDRLLGREDFEYLALFGRREGPYRSALLGSFPRCGVLAGGGVECWGGSRNGVGVVPEGRFAAVSLSFGWGSGRATACGVRVDLSVVCWGWMPPAWRVAPPEGIRVLSVDEEWDK